MALEIGYSQIVEVACSATVFIVFWQLVGPQIKVFIEQAIEREGRTIGDVERVSQLDQKARLVELEVETAIRRAKHETLQQREQEIAQAKKTVQAKLEAAEKEASLVYEQKLAKLKNEKEQESQKLSVEIELLANTVVEKAFYV